MIVFCRLKRSEIALIANTPAMNAMLWKVKHLIRITPITFPQGVPQVDTFCRL